MNETRVYKNSPFMFVLLILIFGGIFFSLFFVTEFENLTLTIPLALLFGIIFLFVLVSATSQTIISNDEISIKNLLGTKSLRWADIGRVSGRGYAIKLHNFDGNLTVAPSPQLPGYEEIVESIGFKRPDLFNPLDYSEMTRSWIGTIFLTVTGLLLMVGLGFFVFTQANDIWMPFLVFVVFGIIFIGSIFVSVQAVAIQGKSIVIGYLFNEKNVLADEVVSIDLRYTQTRNGKNYFVVINLASRKTIRISGLQPNLPVVYLVLKNWHKKNSSLA